MYWVSFIEARRFADSVNAYYERTTGYGGFRLLTLPEFIMISIAGNPDYENVYDRNIFDYGWFQREDVQPVGKKKPNELGIFDMMGNVQEWTSSVIGTQTMGRFIQDGTHLTVTERHTNRLSVGGGVGSPFGGTVIRSLGFHQDQSQSIGGGGQMGFRIARVKKKQIN